MPYCRNCGIQLPEDAQYCTNCGIQLPEKIQYCINCGIQLPEKANYCPKCATPKTPKTPPPTTPTPPPQPANPPTLQPQKTTNKPQHKDLITISTIVMLIILITTLIIALITLTPILQINFNRQNPFEQPGINHLNIVGNTCTTNNIYSYINPQDNKTPWTYQQLTVPKFPLTLNTNS